MHQKVKNRLVGLLGYMYIYRTYNAFVKGTFCVCFNATIMACRDNI